MVIIAALYYLAYHWLIPAYLERTGQPYLIAYLWVWLTSMGTILAISVSLYYLEGRPLNWKAFAVRYRLAHMPRKDWLWTLAVLTVAVGFYFGFHATSGWLGAFPVFSPPGLGSCSMD